MDPDLPAIPDDDTPTIAERALVLRAGGREQPVRVAFGTPRRDVPVVGGHDWRCPVRIEVGDALIRRQALGIDSWQALQLAFAIARDELAALAARPGAELLALGVPLDPGHPDLPHRPGPPWIP
ncbi:DUF6968 family protein [Luteimonas kalidii]|uniref:DUF6968 domain-containing protein n=1 Tax=Luteimonas kalidii TaxID=3042025 RepID=A0ABT6JW85_9GAMM|nr:hypothetical protein [Luteimonas kalidii]MDH5834854.1 hypothetical protein [Luteimonas kalidii]